MATLEEWLKLRKMTGEVGSATYSDLDLDKFILDAGTLDGAASIIWGEKASSYAELVDISEAGSSRKNSDLFKNARIQQLYFAGLPGDGGTLPEGSFTTTRRTVRP